MPKLAIRLLGECQFIYDGEVVAGLQTKRLRSLLGYLLLHAGQQLSALQLAFLFWPDSTEKQARTNLRRLFFNLRQTFPQSDEFLDRGDHLVQWRADSGYTLDVEQFETNLDEATRLLTTEDFGPARDALEAAIETYGGDLLPDSYDDWILVHREELRQRYLGALEQLMDLLEGDGDYRTAIRYGELLLREDSLREKPYRTLMRLHALNGDRAGALRVYHACASELERELGVEPDAETTVLYERLLQSSAAAGAVSVGGARSIHTAEDGQLVGRQAERRSLFSAWRTAASGKATFVLINGEAGIGKTRLAEELYRWAGQLGIRAARAGLCRLDYPCLRPGSGMAAHRTAVGPAAYPRPDLAKRVVSSAARHSAHFSGCSRATAVVRRLAAPAPVRGPGPRYLGRHYLDRRWLGRHCFGQRSLCRGRADTVVDRRSSVV